MTPPPVDISSENAIVFLALLIGYDGGALPLYVDGVAVPTAYLEGTPVEIGMELAARARRWDHVHSRELQIGLPQDRGGGGVGSTTVLWAWAESKDSAWRASTGAFQRCPPTMVMKMGASARRLLLWGLRQPASYFSVEPANKRLAYALHAPQKYALPERLRIPLPGTCLRVGRKRPSPIVVTRLDIDALYTARQVAGRLKDPPPSYMERLRAGEVKK